MRKAKAITLGTLIVAAFGFVTIDLSGCAGRSGVKGERAVL